MASNKRIEEFEKAVKLFKPKYVELYLNKPRLSKRGWWELSFGECDHQWVIRLEKNEVREAIDKIEKVVPVLNLEMFEEYPCGDC